MKPTRHTIAGFLTATALTAAVSGCAPAGGSTGSTATGGTAGGAGDDTCVIGFDPYPNGVSAAHGLVTASVNVNCSQATQIHVVVTLNYDSGNGMHPVADKEFDGTTISTVVTTAPVSCYEGRYRAAYTATARANGDTKTQQQVANAVTLSAGDCHK